MSDSRRRDRHVGPTSGQRPQEVLDGKGTRNSRLATVHWVTPKPTDMESGLRDRIARCPAQMRF